MELLVGGLQPDNAYLVLLVKAQQLIGAMTVVLRQASNGYVKVQIFLYHLACNLHLPCPAVDD